ncbi:MAG: TIGR00295 family protein [Candidatus Altiarchaeota archaeon]|nr:TIGR00295 family protein [Candidatus Altiarchaeota archaeon]
MNSSWKKANNRKPANSRKSITPSQALGLLEKNGCSRDVIAHSRAVSRQAVKIARQLEKKGHKIDVDFIRTAGLLHDIGRGRTHGIRHGIEGGLILKDFPKYARVCKRHLGAGIDRKEAKKLGLPQGDYIPRTLEEKIIAHADNMVEGSKVVPIGKTINAYEEKMGKDHPATRRVVRLSAYIKKMAEENMV